VNEGGLIFSLIYNRNRMHQPKIWIKMKLGEIRLSDMDWIDMIQDKET
jgi:hypothetical protein